MLDFGDVLLHVFTAEERQYYDLESFYKGASEVGPYMALLGCSCVVPTLCDKC